MKRLSDLQLFEEREGEGRAAQRGDHIIYYLQSLFEQRREGEEAGGADHASAEGSALSRRLSEGFHPLRLAHRDKGVPGFIPADA